MKTVTYLTDNRKSVSDLISFWKSRKSQPSIVKLKYYPFITKIDGKTSISFRKYMAYHDNTIPTNYSFRDFQLYTPINKDTSWQEVTSPDGVVYYWNTDTNQTQFEKPENFVKTDSYEW